MIHVGIVGAGFMGRNHFNQYEKLADRARVVALCDQDADRRAGDWSGVGGNIGDREGRRRDLGGIRPYSRFEEMIADPDIDLVDICTPTFTHRDMTVRALEAGRHVLCEKPMALTVEDCDAMIAAAERSGRRFMIAQCIRFWPEYVVLKQAVEAGTWGRLRSLQLRRQAEMPTYTLNSWILDPALSGGAVLDLHIHDVDYCLYLLGKPEAVAAQGCPGPGGGIDRIHAAWRYPHIPVVQIEGWWDMPRGFGFNMGYTAVFDEAALVWDLASGKPPICYRRDQEPFNPSLPPLGDGYYGEIEYFLTCIERGQDPVTSTPRESRDAVAIALLEKESALSRSSVAL